MTAELLLRWLLPLAAVSLAAVAARAPGEIDEARVRAALASRWAPVVAGIATFVLTWWAWGSLDQVATVHDERAYVLQAGIFARGLWSVNAPAMPEFFEQMHVLVAPSVAAKYPPGHALLMTPGVWLGLPGLVPVLLDAAAGAMLFALARRLTNPWVAALSWLLWVATPSALAWRASYFSEVTTAALWLAGWWSLLLWRESRRVAWLVALAAITAWGAITRPLTMLAFAIPVAVVVLRDVVRRRAWRHLWLPAATGAALLAIVPLWSARTTGDWRTTPLTRYTTDYLPFDKPGFGYDSTPARRPLPRELERVSSQFAGYHRDHVLAALPHTLAERVERIADDEWGGWRLGLLSFFALGVAAAGAAGALALTSVVLLVVLYLTYAHPLEWTLYYLEAHAVLSFVTAAGVWRVVSHFATRGVSREDDSPDSRPAPTHLTVAAVVLLLAALIPSTLDARAARDSLARMRRYHQSVRELLDSIPEKRTIVFVRHAPGHSAHRSVVGNDPNPRTARHWVVYDRGPENGRLMRLAPERVPYLLDESAGALHYLTRIVPPP